MGKQITYMHATIKNMNKLKNMDKQSTFNLTIRDNNKTTVHW